MIRAFSYHKAVAPMMWVLVGIATVELVVVHLLLVLWRPGIAFAVGIVTASSILWLVWIIRSFRGHPVLVGPDRLVMRVGRLRSLSVPIDRVAGLRLCWDGAAIKERSVLNLALLAYPNVVVDLTDPVVTKRRRIVAIAHRLNDPAGFAAALERVGPRI